MTDPFSSSTSSTPHGPGEEAVGPGSDVLPPAESLPAPHREPIEEGLAEWNAGECADWDLEEAIAEGERLLKGSVC